MNMDTLSFDINTTWLLICCKCPAKEEQIQGARMPFFSFLQLEINTEKYCTTYWEILHDNLTY